MLYFDQNILFKATGSLYLTCHCIVKPYGHLLTKSQIMIVEKRGRMYKNEENGELQTLIY